MHGTARGCGNVCCLQLLIIMHTCYNFAMDSILYDVIIIGGGPSGLTAAIYTSRAFLKTLVIAGNPPGGQLTTTTEVENFPGFPAGITGPELVENMRKQAERFECTFVNDNVNGMSGSASDMFTVTCSEGTFKAKTIIIASGASAKWLGLESEQRMRGRGVSACATCDAFFYKNKVVAIVGGGDASMEEANFLTKFASQVYVLVRGSKENMKASKIMLQRALDNPKIDFMFNTQVKEVLGEASVTGLRIVNSVDNAEKVLDVQGLFVAIGHQPNTDYLKGFVELDKVGYVVVHENTKTSVEGVFSAGDVADHRYRQAISAAGLGCMAALDAQKYLESK